MLTRMTEPDWALALEIFDVSQSARGEPGHNDRKFPEALHYFTVHNIIWRALPAEFGNWNSVWKRFWRLSRSGVFEVFCPLLAEQSGTAHLVNRRQRRCSTAAAWPAEDAGRRRRRAADSRSSRNSRGRTAPPDGHATDRQWRRDRA